ncbi:dihydroorotate dehydrogenase (quinone) [Alkanindiges hydrocarboniclasticus]|jgi:dihydroorotate dehydrogenase|uniref:Dihydroorotate dehydrogenase (quinone) n=1 Tax=Alkanindiges hydrocarboniclasticus TaxID=1907941 RepID=A0A1S8CX66_9GAMM|nr:quinone-dependent dihydroorotate dehydrogenase [Alkanindiges hydrocarboniclasticus]ONG41920.1 dihydroorotate dehydrogenase (quinone) [Alkanindiges hydrocarboniclasticus]
MLYQFTRPALFALDPERAHNATLTSLKLAGKTGLLSRLYPKINQPVTCMGITFDNPVGLAAGLDKNGDYIDGLAALGFGFIEIGTITPRPQSGNAYPRLFRLPQAQAIINRMGFNNDGVDKLVENVKAAKYKGVLGINIGKNADTPVEKAVDDYLICLDKVYPYASYVTVNISSPNTKGLRSLQSGDALTDLLQQLKQRQLYLAAQHRHYVPLVLKVAPDLSPEDIAFISAQLIRFEIDGLITTNTTLSRDGVAELQHGDEAGGLSGAPVFDRSTECLTAFAAHLQGRIPLIGVGGILNGDQAKTKMDAGASLVQLYSGLIYQGPDLINDCVNAVR